VFNLWRGTWVLVAIIGMLLGCARKSDKDEPLAIRDEQRLKQPHLARVSEQLKSRLKARDAHLNELERKRVRTLEGLAFFPKLPPRFCLLPSPTPAASIDPHRSLFVHDRPTLDGATVNPKKFTLERTLSQLASQVSMVVPGTTSQSMFRQLWDTQNAAPGQVAGGPHCDDDGQTLNGFPNACRSEGSEAVGSDADMLTRMAEYRPLALVNRLDLAHEGWRNCGEHRIVYGKDAGGKNLIIFEAVLPNPKPGCREGCVPVAQFWASLSSMADPNDRAKELERFFYDGLPGYRPVVHIDHYSASGVSTSYGSSGSGQVRTNQFLQSPWMMKEFKTAIDCGTTPCSFELVPIMVKVNPFGTLWNEDVAASAGPFQVLAQEFQADALLNVGALGSTDLLGISFPVDLPHDAAQSFSQSHAGFVDNYREEMNAASADAFRTAFTSAGLTADQLANRALTQSCAGCHMPSTFGLNVANSIGTVTLPGGGTTDQWPDALSFVHVDTGTQLVSGVTVQRISPALEQVFLPDRKAFLVDQLNKIRCACRNRFPFLDERFRDRAVRIEDRVNKQFEPRLKALERDLEEAGSDPARLREVEQAIARMSAERDQQIAGELQREGIKLPANESGSLRPQVLRLKASQQAPGESRRVSSVRIQEVRRMLEQEPPRRTVTGSFRTH